MDEHKSVYISVHLSACASICLFLQGLGVNLHVLSAGSRGLQSLRLSALTAQAAISSVVLMIGIILGTVAYLLVAYLADEEGFWSRLFEDDANEANSN